LSRDSRIGVLSPSNGAFRGGFDPEELPLCGNSSPPKKRNYTRCTARMESRRKREKITPVSKPGTGFETGVKKLL
jgi:hypothetical protein